jgi:DNA-binding GntR family transcriptional regulator
MCGVMKVASPASRARRVDNPLPEIKRLRITDRRQSRLAVHERLRQLILGGSLAPGTVLAQVPLSRALGVSRTPLREALRMLQEEGLVHGEPNHRIRVTGFDSSDLEFVYSTRILLESFAVALTAGSLATASIQSAERALRGMRTAIAQEDFAGWRSAHRDFHRVLVQGASGTLSSLLPTA